MRGGECLVELGETGPRQDALGRQMRAPLAQPFKQRELPLVVGRNDIRTERLEPARRDGNVRRVALGRNQEFRQGWQTGEHLAAARLQVEHAATISRRAKLVKLADKICNLRDIARHPPADWPLERKQAYFDWAKSVVDPMRGVHPGLEAIFDAAYDARPAD